MKFTLVNHRKSPFSYGEKSPGSDAFPIVYQIFPMEIHVFLAATTLGPHTQGTEGRELVDNGAICAQEIQCA